MMENKYIEKVINAGLQKISPSIPEQKIGFDVPKNAKFGDISTNICLQTAKSFGFPPRTLAEKLIAELNYDNQFVKSVELAGAGFINIKFTDKYYQNELKKIIKSGNSYGHTNKNAGKRVNVEYVSANPTGLLHLGHGRNAAIGDTLANLYEWNGWNVTREYYFNNAGNQMNNLGKSIYARMKELLGEKDFPFPEDGYHGDYVRTIAQDIIDKESSKYASGTDDDMAVIRKYGEEWCFHKIKDTLNRMNVHQDIYYNESDLYSQGKIKEVLYELKEKKLSYEKDGAIWFSFTKMGLEADRVIVKSSGEPTYRLPDICYHREKLLRGYDLVVDLFGADHIATVPDVLAGVKALGFDDKKVKVILHQFVTLTENGEQVKMSKRTGKSYTLDELLDDVGEDVVRFFLIMRGVNTHLEFDLSLAKEQSDKNPVFYLQYAHARICSIFEKLSVGSYSLADIEFELLSDNSEITLIKQIMRFPEILELASDKSEPQVLCEYLREIAAAFHIFYHNCRIIGVGEKLMNARLVLANTAKIVLHNGLTILGVSSPERM